jgi:hypothetical protein
MIPRCGKQKGKGDDDMENRTGPAWLEEGEVVILQIPANHSEGSTARGGKLWLTDRRLLFLPHGLDRALGAGSVEIPLSDITFVGKEPAGGGLLSGGLRDRLRVEAVDGSHFLFVVNRLDEVIAQIRSIAPALTQVPVPEPEAPPRPADSTPPPPPPPPPSSQRPSGPGYVSRAPRDMSTALLLEILLGLIGLPGIGWLYSGNTLVGVLLLSGFLVWDLINISIAIATVGLGCLCTVPINLVVVAVSAVLLQNYVKQLR